MDIDNAVINGQGTVSPDILPFQHGQLRHGAVRGINGIYDAFTGGEDDIIPVEHRRRRQGFLQVKPVELAAGGGVIQINFGSAFLVGEDVDCRSCGECLG